MNPQSSSGRVKTLYADIQAGEAPNEPSHHTRAGIRCQEVRALFAAQKQIDVSSKPREHILEPNYMEDFINV